VCIIGILLASVITPICLATTRCANLGPSTKSSMGDVVCPHSGILLVSSTDYTQCGPSNGTLLPSHISTSSSILPTSSSILPTSSSIPPSPSPNATLGTFVLSNCRISPNDHPVRVSWFLYYRAGREGHGEPDKLCQVSPNEIVWLDRTSGCLFNPYDKANVTVFITGNAQSQKEGLVVGNARNGTHSFTCYKGNARAIWITDRIMCNHNYFCQ
jgi:hypothetical protein